MDDQTFSREVCGPVLYHTRLDKHNDTGIDVEYIYEFGIDYAEPSYVYSKGHQRLFAKGRQEQAEQFRERIRKVTEQTKRKNEENISKCIQGDQPRTVTQLAALIGMKGELEGEVEVSPRVDVVVHGVYQDYTDFNKKHIVCMAYRRVRQTGNLAVLFKRHVRRPDEHCSFTAGPNYFRHVNEWFSV